MNRVVVLVLLLWGAPALAQKPQAVALKRQADAYLTEGAPAKAVAAYRKAIALDPKYLDAYESLAAHYLRLQEYGTAITVLEGTIAV